MWQLTRFGGTDAERTGWSESTSSVDVEPPALETPATLELASPRPNPARTTLQVAFGVPAAANGTRLQVAIYDLAGRHVRTLTDAHARPGRSAVTWDLRDARGTPTPAGVYLVRLAAGQHLLMRKVVVLR